MRTRTWIGLTVALSMVIAAGNGPAAERGAGAKTRPVALRLSTQLEVMWDPQSVRLDGVGFRSYLKGYEDRMFRELNHDLGQLQLVPTSATPGAAPRYDMTFNEVPVASEADIAEAVRTSPRTKAREAAKKGWRLGRITVSVSLMMPSREQQIKLISLRGAVRPPRELLERDTPGLYAGVRNAVAEVGGYQLHRQMQGTERIIESMLPAEVWAGISQRRDAIVQEQMSLGKSRQKSEPRIAALQAKLGETQIDLVAKEARLEAIQEQIAKIAVKGDQRVADDPVTTELERIVELHEQQVQRVALLVKSGGQAPQLQQLREAELALSDAKVRLALRRETLRKAVSAELLTRLNTEQALTTIDVHEFQERLMFFSAQLSDIKGKHRAVGKQIAKLEKELAELTPFELGGQLIDIRLAP